MTISTTINRNVGVGNGVTTVFPFTFKILEDEDLVVVTVDGEGTATEQDLGTDYTVTGAGAANGGSVTFAVAPTDGHDVVLYRNVPLTQPTDFKNQSSFYGRTHEAALDRQVMQVQQLADKVERSLRLADDDPTTGVDFRLPQRAVRAGKFLYFDDEGAPAPSDLGAADVAAAAASAAAAANSAAIAVAAASDTVLTMSRRLTAVSDSGHLFDFDFSKVNEPIFGITNQVGEEGGWVADDAEAVLELRFPDLLCIGDSQTARIVTTIPGIGVLAGLNLETVAVGGTTSTQALAQVNALTEDQKHPQVIVVSTGTNDGWSGISLATTKANVLAILAILRTFDSNILWIGCPPVTLADWDEFFTQELLERNKELNEWMEGIARQFGFAFYNSMKKNAVDYDNDDFEWKYPVQMSVDGIHMTNSAYYGMFMELVRKHGTPFFCTGLTVFSLINSETAGNAAVPTDITVRWNLGHYQHYQDLITNSILELPTPAMLPLFGSIGFPVAGGFNGVSISVSNSADDNTGICAVFANYSHIMGGATLPVPLRHRVDGPEGSLRGYFIDFEGLPRFAMIGGIDEDTTVGFRRYDEAGEILDTPIIFLPDEDGILFTLPLVLGSDTESRNLILNGATATPRAVEIHIAGEIKWLVGSGIANGWSVNHYNAGVLNDTPISLGPNVGDPLVVARLMRLGAGLPTHADEAAAVTAGRVTGDIYKTATGELRVKL